LQIIKILGMGIIAKQSLKGSVYTYAGAIIGFINIGLLMPTFFETEEVGLVNLLISFTLMFTQLSGLGFGNVITRIFPYFKNDTKGHNGILTIGIITTTLGLFLSFILFFLLKDFLVFSKSGNSPLLEESICLVPILISFHVFYMLFDSYNKVILDTVTGSFLREFLVRALNLIIIGLYVFGKISFNHFVLLYVFIYILPTVIIIAVLIKRKVFYISKINIEIFIEYKKEMFFIGLFAIISGFSWMAAINIDKYMINYFIDLSAAGIYTVAISFGSVIGIPSRALRRISSVIISEAWKQNDKKIIIDVYKKSTINLLVIAVFLFIGIWINIDNIYSIIPKFSGGKFVFLFVGISSIVEMGSGIASLTIANSKYFRFNAYVVVFLILFVVITNIIFIPIWGVIGAAFASMLCTLIAVVSRFLFLNIKYKFQPYSYNHLIVFIIGGGIILINYFLPRFENVFIDIFIRSAFVTVFYIPLILITNVSEDINKYYKTILLFIKQRK